MVLIIIGSLLLISNNKNSEAKIIDNEVTETMMTAKDLMNLFDENEESTILNVSVKDGDTVTIKGKVIKEVHKRGTEEFLYKIKDLEIRK